MAEPVDIDSLKVEDIVIKSTPQQRETPRIAEEKKEEPKKETPKPDAKEGKVQDPPGEEEESDEGKPAGEEGEENEGEEAPEFNWDAFSEEVGIELDSDDQVVASLKELASYKSLSPALQQAIEIERSGGDVASYFKVMANDPKELSERDALWEQYVADNPKRVAVNPKFARMDFDRKVDREYKLLTEYENLTADEQEEFLLEHKAEIDYLKEKRAFDAEAARASLQEKRDKATFNTPKAKVDENRVKEIMARHEAGYKKALKEFDSVSLQMGEDLEFNVGLTDSNKKQAQEWMKNPEAFLRELGFRGGESPDDPIDYDTLAGWVALIADIKFGTFGERLRQSILDNKDIQTLEKTLDAPGVGKTTTGIPDIQGDDWSQVGAAFEKKRLESQKKR